MNGSPCLILEMNYYKKNNEGKGSRIIIKLSLDKIN